MDQRSVVAIRVVVEAMNESTNAHHEAKEVLSESQMKMIRLMKTSCAEFDAYLATVTATYTIPSCFVLELVRLSRNFEPVPKSDATTSSVTGDLTTTDKKRRSRPFKNVGIGPPKVTFALEFSASCSSQK